MDRYDERHAEMPARASQAGDVPAQLHASESVSRVVAYTSPYVFWVTVAILSMAIILLQ